MQIINTLIGCQWLVALYCSKFTLINVGSLHCWPCSYLISRSSCFGIGYTVVIFIFHDCFYLCCKVQTFFQFLLGLSIFSFLEYHWARLIGMNISTLVNIQRLLCSLRIYDMGNHGSCLLKLIRTMANTTIVRIIELLLAKRRSFVEMDAWRSKYSTNASGHLEWCNG